MNIFKRKQLSRVIESIGRAANFSDSEIDEKIEKYTIYDNYEKTLKDLTCELYERFYIKDNALCNYSLDMIKNIGFNYFSSQEEMIKYAAQQINKKKHKVSLCSKQNIKNINKNLKK